MRKSTQIAVPLLHFGESISHMCDRDVALFLFSRLTQIHPKEPKALIFLAFSSLDGITGSLAHELLSL